VAAILHNGLGRYADAFAAARQVRADSHLHMSMWALPELIEAAVHTSNTKAAHPGGACRPLAATAHLAPGARARAQPGAGPGSAPGTTPRRSVGQVAGHGAGSQSKSAGWCLGRWSLGLRVCLPGAGQGLPYLSA